jgi:hypothetical protein
MAKIGATWALDPLVCSGTVDGVLGNWDPIPAMVVVVVDVVVVVGARVVATG